MIRRQERRTPRARGTRARLLLVLAVLTGVLGMHGLVSAPAPHASTAHTSHGHAGAAPARAHSDAEVHAAGPAAHDDPGGGHAEHADGTCAASGLGAAPALPALAPAPCAPAPQAYAAAHDGPAGAEGRGPPALSELQVLRI
ncbi:DUF6153 family protein [Streptomyces sp. t39]|uniref:DUF6153 family protein n=1 Tax=Streptomyces sp. t39 TaxID=1828156 RepID=UPI0011CE9D5E|nr:DUF6153 family protein [Streptomyces sp. t39]TXS55027.1 hypothetical protein EAO77_01525 [Streptomyces sp. t39]